jgi:ELWxxDGT repeat protein
VDGSDESTVEHTIVSSRNLVALGDAFYFPADELWKSDGTDEGTVVITINSTWDSSHPSDLTVVGNAVYFAATDGINGYQLWLADSSGVVPTAVSVSTDSSSITYDLVSRQELTAVGDTLFFAANDGIHGYELWKSDGTDEGTAIVKDLRPYQLADSAPFELTAMGDTLYFVAKDVVHDYQLWKSDGTNTGTVMVSDFGPDWHPLLPGAYDGSSPRHLTVMGDTLYYIARGQQGHELWRSDGTTEGTVAVKDLPVSQSWSHSYELTAVGDTLYFVTSDPNVGFKLWKSDGTTEGTVMLRDIPTGDDWYGPKYLTAIGNALYFRPMTVSMAMNYGNRTARLRAPSWSKIFTWANDGPIHPS